MSLVIWILVGLGLWVALGVAVGLVLGRIMRQQRDRQIPHGPRAGA